MKFRPLVLAWCLLLASAFAVAAPLSKIGVLSSLGDEITVVVHQPQTGTLLDPNRRQRVDLADGGFDGFATKAAMAAAGRAAPQAALQAYEIALPPEMNAAAWLAGGRFAPPPELRERLAAGGVSHLLLLVKHRGEAQLQLAHSSTGTGYLEGLGFYIDGQLRTRRSDTGQAAIGFLAPYAYFEAALIDVASGEVLQSRSVSASAAFSTARNPDSVNPWEALTPQQKVASIRRLLRTQLDRVVPELLQQP